MQFTIRTYSALFFFVITFSTKAQEPRLMLPIGHTGYILNSCITPDGKKVVTVGSDKKIILWDLETGLRLADLMNDNRAVDKVAINKQSTRILGVQKYSNELSIPLWSLMDGSLITKLNHSQKITSAAFDPSGTKIITGSYDGFAKIWDARNGKLLDSLTITGMVMNVSFSSDGSKILTSNNRAVQVWDAATVKKLIEIDAHTDLINDAIFSPDNSKILTASNDHTAKVWDALTGQLIYLLTLNDDVNTAYFNSTGDAIVTEVFSISNKNFKLWDAQSGKLKQTLVGDKAGARFATFSHNGKLVVSGSDEKEVKVWESGTGKLIYTLKDHYGGARDAIFSPDDTKLVIGTGSTNTKVWDLKTGLLINDFKSEVGSVIDIEMSNDGKRLIIPADTKAVVWDLEKKALVAELKGSTSQAVQKINFSADQKMIITDNNVNSFTRLWDVEKGDMYGGAIYSQNDIDRMIYSKSYQKVMVRYKDSRTIEIWDIQKGDLLTTLNKKHSSYQNRWVFSPDETLLITASASDSLINVWDIKTGEVSGLFKRSGKVSINDILFSLDSKKLMVTDNNQLAEIWDLKTREKIVTIPKIAQSIPQIEFIENSNWILVKSNKENKIWDISTGKLVLDIVGHPSSIRYFSINPDKTRLFTSSFHDDEVKLWNLTTKQLITTLKRNKKTIGIVQASPDWKYIVTTSIFEPIVGIYDGETGVLNYEIRATGAPSISGLLFDKSSSFIFTYGNDNAIRKWDLATGKMLQVFNWPKTYISCFAYNDETKELIAGSNDGSIKLWDAESASVINIFKGHIDRINVVKFGIKKNTIISASEDQTIKVWNKTTAKTMHTFFPVGNADFLNQVSHGYYKSSPGASRSLHYVSTDLKPITFNQLDVKYNRPDKVLKEMGSTDTALIAAYHKAYLKRVKKIGIDTLAFSSNFDLPQVDFVNREQIASDQKKNLIQLHIKGRDSATFIDRFNIWVNENPIFGMKGFSLKSRKTHIIDTTITLSLNYGVNQLETSIVNSNGTESYRMPIIVNYRPDKQPVEKLYFVGIGIDEFVQNQNNLKWSVKDIRDQAKALSLKYGENINIDTLFNKEVTVKNIVALKEKLKQSTVNDKVIVAYSGHGLLSKDYDYFLSTYAVNFDKPEENGLPYDALEDLLDQIPARKKLMLIDACHSGEVDKEELLKFTAAQKNLDSNKIEGSKGVKVTNNGQQKTSMKSSLELMQQLFVNVSQSTGATVISAAAGTQFALEKNDLKNGVFSFSILEYLKANNHATVTDLKKYVNKRVVELTSGLQVPTTRNETSIINWNVW